jgi:hypothetical protein
MHLPISQRDRLIGGIGFFMKNSIYKNSIFPIANQQKAIIIDIL